MAAQATPLLTNLRERLVREAADGRRQRLFGLLVAALREATEQVAMTAPPACQVSALLGLVAVAVRATGQPALAKALAAPLARTLNPPEELARYLRPEVAWTVVETHRYRADVTLPPGLPAGDDPAIEPLLQAAFTALGGLPTDLLEAVLLCRYARPRATADLLVLVPPTMALSRAAARDTPRPPAGPWPTELAASTPAGAAVVDARAERMWLDEAVAEVTARRPRVVALQQPEAPAAAFDALLDLLGAALPETAFWLLAEAATQPADRRFEQVLAGPPFDGLRRLTTGEPGDPSAWPLACYRQCATDADVVLPVVGRSGAALASQLETAAEACPAARLRLAPGLTAAQAAELTLAIRRPAPPAWSLPLAGAALPAEPATLRRAGLDTVVVQVGAAASPPRCIPR